MEQTLESSNTIYDHITQLSASSQEVAAASGEGLDNSNITVGEVAKCKQIFESIYELAKDLQNSLKCIQNSYNKCIKKVKVMDCFCLFDTT